MTRSNRANLISGCTLAYLLRVVIHDQKYVETFQKYEQNRYSIYPHRRRNNGKLFNCYRKIIAANRTLLIADQPWSQLLKVSKFAKLISTLLFYEKYDSWSNESVVIVRLDYDFVMLNRVKCENQQS